MSHPNPNSLRRLVPKIEAARTPSASPTDEGSTASTKRRCISSACMPCRKRKSKVSVHHHRTSHTITDFYIIYWLWTSAEPFHRSVTERSLLVRVVVSSTRRSVRMISTVITAAKAPSKEISDSLRKKTRSGTSSSMLSAKETKPMSTTSSNWCAPTSLTTLSLRLSEECLLSQQQSRKHPPRWKGNSLHLLVNLL